MQITDLPALNAALNGAAALLLVGGYQAIRSNRVERHRAFMVAATSVSGLFLISYLFYHYHHGSTRFTGEGAIRPIYFTVLISHTILATALVPLLSLTLWNAARGQFERHRRIARVTWPVWMYVSVTGVLIYFMLYQWFAPTS